MVSVTIWVSGGFRFAGSSFSIRLWCFVYNLDFFPGSKNLFNCIFSEILHYLGKCHYLGCFDNFSHPTNADGSRMGHKKEKSASRLVWRINKLFILYLMWEIGSFSVLNFTFMPSKLFQLVMFIITLKISLGSLFFRWDYKSLWFYSGSTIIISRSNIWCIFFKIIFRTYEKQSEEVLADNYMLKAALEAQRRRSLVEETQ